MTKFQIKSRWDDAKVLFECKLPPEIAAQEYGSQLGFAIKKALKEDANLRGANLEGVNLGYTNLRGANLGYTNLGGAYLEGANLRGTSLRYVYLGGANLVGTSLEGANLRGANLGGVNLRDANLRDIKKDFLGKLSLARNEALALYDYLMKGKINGSVYEGECACFCGTIANIRHEDYEKLGIDLRPDSDCPTERWFLAIQQGDTPQNSQVSAITAEWMREFMDSEEIEYPTYEIVAIKEK